MERLRRDLQVRGAGMGFGVGVEADGASGPEHTIHSTQNEIKLLRSGVTENRHHAGAAGLRGN